MILPKALPAAPESMQAVYLKSRNQKYSNIFVFINNVYIKVFHKEKSWFNLDIDLFL